MAHKTPFLQTPVLLEHFSEMAPSDLAVFFLCSSSVQWMTSCTPLRSLGDQRSPQTTEVLGCTAATATASWCFILGGRSGTSNRAERRRALTLISHGTLPASALRSSSHARVVTGACDTAALLSVSSGATTNPAPLARLQLWSPPPRMPLSGLSGHQPVLDIVCFPVSGVCERNWFHCFLWFGPYLRLLLFFLGCCLPFSLGSAYKTPLLCPHHQAPSPGCSPLLERGGGGR